MNQTWRSNGGGCQPKTYDVAAKWHGIANALLVLLVLLVHGSSYADAQQPTPPPFPEIEPVSFPDAGLPEHTIPTQNLLQVIRDGGPLMLPIGICSFILMVFVFERSISLRRGRVIPRPFVKRFLQQIRDGELDRETALELCERNRSPVSEIFAAAVRKWGRPSVEVEQAIIDAGERVTNNLRRYLRVLNGVSTISPLLGMLGTVLGMIRAFNAIATADAMGNPEMLAGGISQALITTAAGLSVAIPALIAYLYFSGRVDQLIMMLDELGQRLVVSVAGDIPGGRTEGERIAGKPDRRRPAA
ncbi:MAG: MotA/TolQ/ExbB proton channel family protein [Planctomycetaceae bacterium]|nr:MAG: MotA/TolQ/ExbB proton channel family protein [Planctomycetaceae bacterium]